MTPSSRVPGGPVVTANGQLRYRQTQRALADRGVRYRIVNLSFSGARVSDVLNRQIPALAGLSAAPELVTVLIGSNDVIKRDLRARLPERYRAMLSARPAGALVATVPRTRGVQAEINRIVGEAAAGGAVVAVPLHFVAGARARTISTPTTPATRRSPPTSPPRSSIAGDPSALTRPHGLPRDRFPI
jgi:GDSL-like Lipase/Acylhydrolase family